jgi:hypothetical protein
MIRATGIEETPVAELARTQMNTAPLGTGSTSASEESA